MYVIVWIDFAIKRDFADFEYKEALRGFLNLNQVRKYFLHSCIHKVSISPLQTQKSSFGGAISIATQIHINAFNCCGSSF